MKRGILLSITLLLVGAATFAFLRSGYAIPNPVEGGLAQLTGQKPGKTMRAFRSEQELKDYFKAIAEKQNRDRREAKEKVSNLSAQVASPSVSADGFGAVAKTEESVTNTQHDQAAR